MIGTETIGVRHVDKKAYREFKMKCIEKNYLIGTAISEAMKLWCKEEDAHSL